MSMVAAMSPTPRFATWRDAPAAPRDCHETQTHADGDESLVPARRRDRGRRGGRRHRRSGACAADEATEEYNPNLPVRYLPLLQQGQGAARPAQGAAGSSDSDSRPLRASASVKTARPNRS